MDVSYDSGCQSMAFPYSEAEPMLTQAAASNLQPVASLLCIYGAVCGKNLDADYYCDIGIHTMYIKYYL